MLLQLLPATVAFKFKFPLSLIIKLLNNCKYLSEMNVINSPVDYIFIEEIMQMNATQKKEIIF